MDDRVAGTARTTASIRAWETARADALFRDPLAEALAGPEAMAALHAMPENLQERFAEYTVVRTRVFDEWLLSVTAPPGGVSQVVLLGAGFDARVFRLQLPSTTIVWELDQPELLSLKDSILADVAPTPTPHCERRTVAVDFSQSTWPEALLAAGFQSELPTAWLAEGVVPYLEPDVAVRLIDTASKLSPLGSKLAVDVVDQASLVSRNQYLAALERTSPSVRGAPFRFGVDDAAKLFVDHGWSVSSVLRPGDPETTFGRFAASPAPSGLPRPLLSFVFARRLGT